MSIFGAGMLVGTALSVIIPEGITTLYDSSFKGLIYFYNFYFVLFR